jgi:hypothetical protein
MDITNRSPRRFGGLMMTDQRGADEAVMLMRLVPDQDEPFSLEFYGCLIIGALHMFKRPTGLTFDIVDTPSVTDAKGKPVPCLTSDRQPDTMRVALERIRGRLRSRSTEEQGPAVPPVIVDQLRFFVFEKGDAPVTLEWRVVYAGKTYPLHQPVRSR